MNKKTKQQKRVFRAARVQVFGTATRPRLSVFRSLKTIYAQIIDDEAGKTLVSATAKDVKAEKGAKKIDVSKEVGKVLAERAKAKGITKVSFDKGAYKYHGRVASLADGAREGGLEF
jgi:large subunit ribosomal protein L18